MIEEVEVREASSEHAAVRIERAKQLRPFFNRRIGGFKDDLRSKPKDLASVNGFASFVGLLARFRSAIFVLWDQRITICLCMDRAVVMNTTIGE